MENLKLYLKMVIVTHLYKLYKIKDNINEVKSQLIIIIKNQKLIIKNHKKIIN